MSGWSTAAPITCRLPAFKWAPRRRLSRRILWWPSFPSRAEIARLLGESAWTSATDLVLLDPGEPDGYVRKWTAPGFPPVRHVAYAVQWFALALTLAVIYVVTNTAPGAKRRSRMPSRHERAYRS